MDLKVIIVLEKKGESEAEMKAYLELHGFKVQLLAKETVDYLYSTGMLEAMVEMRNQEELIMETNVEYSVLISYETLQTTLLATAVSIENNKDKFFIYKLESKDRTRVYLARSNELEKNAYTTLLKSEEGTLIHNASVVDLTTPRVFADEIAWNYQIDLETFLNLTEILEGTDEELRNKTIDEILSLEFKIPTEKEEIWM